MRLVMGPIFLLAASGCTVERIGPPGITMTRPVAVKPRNVLVFGETQRVPGPFSIVEEIYVKDDGDKSVEELERDLRSQAGARGANAILLHPLNRKDNGTRVKLGIHLDDPFDYYRATAVYMGPGPRPEIYLGALGGERATKAGAK